MQTFKWRNIGTPKFSAQRFPNAEHIVSRSTFQYLWYDGWSFDGPSGSTLHLGAMSSRECVIAALTHPDNL